MGWDGKNDKSGQFKHAVRVSNVKIGKFVFQELLGYIS